MSLPRVAVLGTGSIGLRHLEVLKALGAHAIAVPIRPGRREALEAQGWATAESLADAVALGAQAAVVASDTRRHPEDACAALALGLPVLCEKPLASNEAAARQIVRAASTSPGPAFVAFCLRHEEGLAALRSRLAEVGEIHGVRAECRSFLPEWRPQRDFRESYSASLDQGGVLRDLSHETDYLRLLFGHPRTVTCRTAGGPSRLGIRAEEAIEAVWVAPGSVLVSLSLDYLTRSPVRFVRISGARGELSYDFIGRAMRFSRPRQRSEEVVISGQPSDMYRRQMVEFLRAISDGKPGDLATIRDGLAVVSLCEAMRRSSQSGREEDVSDP